MAIRVEFTCSSCGEKTTQETAICPTGWTEFTVSWSTPPLPGMGKPNDGNAHYYTCQRDACASVFRNKLAHLDEFTNTAGIVR